MAPGGGNTLSMRYWGIKSNGKEVREGNGPQLKEYIEFPIKITQYFILVYKAAGHSGQQYL